MNVHDAAVLEDRDRLEAWLASQGFVPYADFEILAVELEARTVEVDPKGNTERLLPALEEFADQNGFLVDPFEPESGVISLLQAR